LSQGTLFGITQTAAPVRSQDSAAQARIAIGKPVANLESRRLRLLSRPAEGGERKEKEDREEKKEKKEKEEKEEKEEKKDIEKSQIEPRFEGTNGQPVVSLAPYIKSAKGSSTEGPSTEGPSTKGPPKGRVKKEKSGEGETTSPASKSGIKTGIKRRRSGKAGDEDMPPTPWGCEWLKTGDGWNLWRYWSEKDRVTGERIKKSRYAGYLSHDAWQVMKGYDYETFISIIGQRFRRYGQR
jgi:hypothetical protein